MTVHLMLSTPKFTQEDVVRIYRLVFKTASYSAEPVVKNRQDVMLC